MRSGTAPRAVLCLAVAAACGGSDPIGPPGRSGPTILWSRAVDTSTDSAIEVAAGRVVVTDGMDVVGLDAADGSESWRVQVDRFGSFQAEITAEADEVFVFQLATSAALDAGDGSIRWRHEERSTGRIPLVDGGRVFGVVRGVVSALDRGTGGTVWTTDLETPRDGLVAVDAGVLCVATRLLALGPAPTEEIVCLDREDGGILWRFEDPRLIAPEGLVVRDGRAIVGTADGWLLAVDVESGTLAWEVELPATLWSDLAASGERVVACTSDRGRPVCEAFHPGDGARIWSAAIEGVILAGSPVVADGAVWLVEKGALTALDLATGARVFGPVVPDESIPFFAGTPAVEDGVAYVFSFDRLYAIRVAG